MPIYRVRATSRQAYTQYFELAAATPDEALSLVAQGNIEIVDECFDHVEAIEPLAAQVITHDPSASAEPAPIPTADESTVR